MWGRLRDAQNSVRIALAGRECRFRSQAPIVHVSIVHARRGARDHPMPLDWSQLEVLHVEEVAALRPRDRRGVKRIEYRHHWIPVKLKTLEGQAGLGTA